MSIRNLSDTRVEDALEIFSPNSIVKLDFVQTHGNWKIEAGNSNNNTLIIGSVSNATNNITLDTTNGGSATFSGGVGVAGSSIVEKFNTPNIKVSGSTITGAVSANTLLIDNLSSTSRFYSCGADASTNGTFNFNTGTSSALGATMLTLASTGATFVGTVATTGLDVQRNSGSSDDILRITSADVVTTIQRIENSSDAAAGFGRIEFKTNAATGQVSGRGGFKFIDGDGNDILYLDNDNASATFGGNIVMGGNQIKFADNGKLMMGDSNDLQIFHNGSNSFIEQTGTGDLYIQQATDDKDIIFRNDNGSGGLTTYFFLDGGAADGNFVFTEFPDQSKAVFGNSQDLQLYHSGGNSYIDETGPGHLFVRTNGDGIYFRSETDEEIAHFNRNAGVKLYFDNSQKFETTSTGIEVSGTSSTFSGSVILGATSNGNAVNKLTIASGTNGDGIFLTGLGTGAGMGTGNYKAIDFQYSNTDSSFGSAIRFVVRNSTAHGGQIEFFTDNSSGTNTRALTINKSQYLGIGTDSPLYKTQINVAGNGETALAFMNSSVTSDGGGSTNIRFVSATNAQWANASFSAYNYSFFGNNSERVTILGSNGNVGIGVTGPDAKLDVRVNGIGSVAGNESNSVIFQGDRHDWIFKQIRTANGSDWNNTTLRLQTRVDSTLMSSIDFVTDASYNRHIDINTASNSFNTRFTHGGNVGIGTISPDAKLDVNGELYVRSVIQAYAGAGNPIGGISWTSTDSGFLFAKHGNVTKVLLNSNGDSYLNGGKVGIGTTSPTSPLMIAGSGADGTAMLRLEGTGGTQTFNWISSVVYPNMTADKTIIKLFGQAQSTNNQAWMGFKYAGSGSTSNQLSFGFYANNFLFNIKATGNVGIGTESPSYKLEVNGTANIVSHLTAHCLGVGTAAPAANGVIRAAGDIIAYYSSDKNLKDNITKIEKPLEKLEKINGYEFDWNDKQELYEGHDVGVVAQEIEEIYPQLVETREDGYKAVKYEKLVPLLIESIKELKKEIDNIKTRSWQSDY